MDFDGRSFPPRVDFDNPRRSYRPNITVGRIVILLALLAAVGLVIACVTFLPDLVARMDNRRRAERDNPIRAIGLRLNAHLQNKNYDAALTELDRLEKAIVPNVQTRLLRCHVLAKQKKYREAAQICDEVIRRQETPESVATAYNNRAYFRALQGVELEEARRDIEQAIAIGGDNAAFLDTRAYLHYLFGEHKPALADLNKVLNHLDLQAGLEDVGEIYFHRGLVYRALGEAEMADRDFESARQHGFDVDNEPAPLDRQPDARAL